MSWEITMVLGTKKNHATAAWRCRWIVVIGNMILLTGCGDKQTTPAPPPPMEGSATIGIAGGTVNGPDGTQLIVPEGALDSDVTIRIERSSAGAPELPYGVPSNQAVYAVTPHDLRFNKAVTLRVPYSGAAAADAAMLVASPGGEWRAEAATIANNIASVQRGALSWYSLWTGSTNCRINPNAPVDLFPCHWATIGHGTISTTPLAAINSTSGGDTIRQAATVHVPVLMSAAGDCSNGNLRIRRRHTGPGRVFLPIPEADVPITLVPSGGTTNSAVGAYTFDAAVGAADNDATVWFDFTFQCVRAYQGVVSMASATMAYVVRILPAVSAPIITQHPAAITVTVGETANFTVLATAPSGFTVNWVRTTGGNNRTSIGPGTAINGGSALSFVATLADNGVRFYAGVCNGAIPITCTDSNQALLTVIAAPVAPVFVTHPNSLAIIAGQTASFTAVANGTPAPSLRWQIAAPGSSVFVDVIGEANCSPTPAPGSGAQTSSTCTLSQTAVGNSGERVRAVAVNSVAPSGVISNDATLTINPAAVAPSITQQPTPQTAPAAGSATFNVTATGTATLSYQWRLNGTDLPAAGLFLIGTCNGTVAYSADHSAVILSQLSTDCNGASVQVTVSNGVNPNAVSSSAVLTVLAPTQALSLLAGSIGGQGMMDGTGSAARFSMSGFAGVAFDSQGNAYIGDTNNGRVRRITPAGAVTTFAGPSAMISSPNGVVIDATDNVYVANYAHHNILRITPQGVVSVWAGRTDGLSGDVNATGTDAQFNGPTGLAIDAAGNVYVTEITFSRNMKVRKISPAAEVTTFYDFGPTGGGEGIAIDAAGNAFVTGVGSDYQSILRIAPNGSATVFSGEANTEGSNDGVGTAARFRSPRGLAFDTSGNLFVGDANNRIIRRITPAGVVSTISGTPGGCCYGDGIGGAASYNFPTGMAFAPSGDLVIADSILIRKLNAASVATTLAGQALASGTNDGFGSAARFRWPRTMVLDANGNVFVTDIDRIRRISPSGAVTTFATGLQTNHMVVDAAGNLYVAGSRSIWRVTPAATATLLAGDPNLTDYVDGTGTEARFYNIGGLAVDSAGNAYVSELQHDTIRRVTPAGEVTTIAGAISVTGSDDGAALSARFNIPSGLAIDSAGNVLIADRGNHLIRRLTPGGVVSTLAGSALEQGTVDATGAAARFNQPNVLAFDPNGNLLIGDLSSCVIRRMTPANVVTTVLGFPNVCTVSLGLVPRLNYMFGILARDANRFIVTSEGAVLDATIP